MSATAGQAQDERGQAERLGIKPGQVVQEIGYDDDCDEQLRDAIAQVDGVELVDEDYDDVVDVVLLWWRDGDGDLVDALVDALTPLADGGYIWLLTPKAGRDGHVELACLQCRHAPLEGWLDPRRHRRFAVTPRQYRGAQQRNECEPRQEFRYPRSRQLPPFRQNG